MEWKDIELEKPSVEKIGTYFLVAVKNTGFIDYEIAEWYLFDEEDGPYFAIKLEWCGQHTVNRKVIYWCEIDELPE